MFKYIFAIRLMYFNRFDVRFVFEEEFKSVDLCGKGDISDLFDVFGYIVYFVSDDDP